MELANSLSPPIARDPGVMHTSVLSRGKGQGYRQMACSKPSLTSFHFELAVAYKLQRRLREDFMGAGTVKAR